jgi:dTMP kinase
MRQARFITFEGIEGVGKSTQLLHVSAALEVRGIEHILTREPGGTPLAEKIRSLVLTQQEEALPSSAELLLMFAARAVHLENLIEPSIAAGRWVLCDRFTDATFAYQGGGRGLDANCIRQLQSLVHGGRQPDLTFLLDAPVELALTRARQRNGSAQVDRFESERLEFFVRVRRAYLQRAAAEPQRIAVLDAAQAADEVCARILEILQERAWIS